MSYHTQALQTCPCDLTVHTAESWAARHNIDTDTSLATKPHWSDVKHVPTGQTYRSTLGPVRWAQLEEELRSNDNFSVFPDALQESALNDIGRAMPIRVDPSTLPEMWKARSTMNLISGVMNQMSGGHTVSGPGQFILTRKGEWSGVRILPPRCAESRCQRVFEPGQAFDLDDEGDMIHSTNASAPSAMEFRILDSCFTNNRPADRLMLTDAWGTVQYHIKSDAGRWYARCDPTTCSDPRVAAARKRVLVGGASAQTGRKAAN